MSFRRLASTAAGVPVQLCSARSPDVTMWISHVGLSLRSSAAISRATGPDPPTDEDLVGGPDLCREGLHERQPRREVLSRIGHDGRVVNADGDHQRAELERAPIIEDQALAIVREPGDGANAIPHTGKANSLEVRDRAFFVFALAA